MFKNYVILIKSSITYLEVLNATEVRINKSFFIMIIKAYNTYIMTKILVSTFIL